MIQQDCLRYPSPSTGLQSSTIAFAVLQLATSLPLEKSAPFVTTVQAVSANPSQGQHLDESVWLLENVS
jgi:hypothetical protein